MPFGIITQRHTHHRATDAVQPLPAGAPQRLAPSDAACDEKVQGTRGRAVGRHGLGDGRGAWWNSGDGILQLKVGLHCLQLLIVLGSATRYNVTKKFFLKHM